MSYIDFEAVKAANPIEDLAERLGLTLTKKGDTWRGPCPSGKGNDRALAITPAKQVWYSFGLNEGGDVLKLVQLVNECSLKEAAQFLSDTVPLEKADRPEPDEGEEARGGFRPLTYLVADHPAVEALGLAAEDAEALGIGFAPRGTMRNFVAVPIRRSDGAIAGYIGITEAQLPKQWQL